jgi:hypothetical protein
MIAVITILGAFPLGYLVRSRLAANTTYAVAYLWAFTFQSVYLMLDLLDGGKDPAFEPGTFPVSYGVVALGIFLVGFGLVQLGHWARGRRQESRRSSLTGTSASAATGKTAASAKVAG